MPALSNERLCKLAQAGDTAACDILLENNIGKWGWMKMILELI